eukprot:9450578-Ditylum_brightwellii.AAC.1
MGIIWKDDKTADTLVDIVEPTPPRRLGKRKKARDFLTSQPTVDPRHAKHTILAALSARPNHGRGTQKTNANRNCGCTRRQCLVENLRGRPPECCTPRQKIAATARITLHLLPVINATVPNHHWTILTPM